MPKFEFETKIGPASVMSGLSLLSIIFLGGMIWAQLTGAQAQLRKDVDSANARVDQVNVRINTLHAHDTSIQVLQRDVKYIGDIVNRIEQRMMKLGN